MPEKCVVYGCSNRRNASEGISLHVIPFNNDERAEAKRRRKRWVDFVSRTRAHWKPTPRSVICSKHFRQEDFAHAYSNPGEEGSLANRWLIRDEVGIAVFPSIHTPSDSQEISTERDKRMIVRRAKTTLSTVTSSESGEPSSSTTSELPQRQSETNESDIGEGVPEHVSEDPQLSPLMPDVPPVNCSKCPGLLHENRMLQNSVKTLREAAKKRRVETRKLRRKAQQLQCTIEHMKKAQHQDIPGSTDSDVLASDSEDEKEDDDHEMEVDEQDDDGDGSGSSNFKTESESESESPSDDDIMDSAAGSTLTDKSIRSEPKHIVFLSQLLLLFEICHFCKADKPVVEMPKSGSGTNVTITTKCNNCKKEFTWHSQPLLPGSLIRAGNFLLSFAIVVSGGSATKVMKMFQHMGLGCISLNTFFKHQREKIFPAIYIHWQKYQKSMFTKVKAISGGIAIAGDGRHDSMGHSAKFCAYTILSCTADPMIIHFDMVQRNQAGSSPAMEFMAFQRCMEYLLRSKLVITTFVSDRHASIASHMRDVLSNITHYFDIWHIKKKIRKVLTKLAKQKGFQAISEWIKPCENHLYWSATSTHDGNGAVIWAKFKAFLSHIINVHTDLDEPLFSRCAHGEIGPKKWLTKGSVVHERLSDVLTSKTLTKAVKKASPLAQTSSLEGFHSVVNHFAPKMLAFSYTGMYCRHILAILHFNANLQREVKLKEDGSQRVKISYPKFKNGEASVRNIKIKQNFNYVEEIFRAFMDATKEEIIKAAVDLKKQSPAPMNTMLDKQTRDAALKKKDDRSKMVTENVPPTTPVIEPTQPSQPRKERQPPKCTLCKHPMKGHKNVRDCPKNQS